MYIYHVGKYKDDISFPPLRFSLVQEKSGRGLRAFFSVIETAIRYLLLILV
jgi:hypothetical protein